MVKERSSNLELFRIITMILIVAHHYVGNSGVWGGCITPQNMFTLKTQFYLLLGAWGKVGINCFLMITGYFMCKSNITVKKYLKLLLQIYFYRLVINSIFFITSYDSISLKKLLIIFVPFTAFQSNFTSCFLMFYLLIPFINILINNMTEKQHLLLLAILLFVFTICGSIPKFQISYSYISWFGVIYLIAAYIRCYPKAIFDNKKFWLLMFLLSIIISILSVIVFSWICQKFNKNAPCFLLNDSNKLLAVITAITSFMFFKNLDIKYSKFINTVGSTTFGVLLIHANSDTMRQWLWCDLLKNTQWFESRYFSLHAIISILVVFIICTFIDYLRIVLLEKPLFNLIDRKTKNK